jgi:hypothetical protein
MNKTGILLIKIVQLGQCNDNEILDYQIIDVLNDHLCYVITDKRTPWHLPFRRSFRLVSKVVITFVSKSKSKLAIYTNVEWLKSPLGLKSKCIFCSHAFKHFLIFSCF